MTDNKYINSEISHFSKSAPFNLARSRGNEENIKQIIQTEHEQIDALRIALHKVHGKSVGFQKVKKTTFTVYYIAILENVSNVLLNHI